MRILQLFLQLEKKKIIGRLIIALLLLPGIGINQNVPPRLISNASGENIPSRLARKFHRDAARLVLRMEATQEDLRFQNIQIPRSNIENIYKILTTIYTEDETAKAIANCNVHTFPSPSIDHFVLIFKRQIAWATPLYDGIHETTSEEFNELIDDYDLIIERYVQWNDTQDAITIRATEPLNVAALANEFYNIEGVEGIDLGLPKVDGNDIQMKRIPQGWQVEYILKFGSHITGDGKTHIWTYEAMDDGKVKFISETGDEVPSWMKCELMPNTFTAKI